MRTFNLIFLCLVLAVLTAKASAGLLDPLTKVSESFNDMLKPVNNMFEDIFSSHKEKSKGSKGGKGAKGGKGDKAAKDDKPEDESEE